uniref:Uncharacterized protein n=1 Tax=Anopheles atroparvus TaxID=41427 RepID=A0A182J1S4_ANOAO
MTWDYCTDRGKCCYTFGCWCFGDEEDVSRPCSRRKRDQKLPPPPMGRSEREPLPAKCPEEPPSVQWWPVGKGSAGCWCCRCSVKKQQEAIVSGGGGGSGAFVTFMPDTPGATGGPPPDVDACRKCPARPQLPLARAPASCSAAPASVPLPAAPGPPANAAAALAGGGAGGTRKDSSCACWCCWSGQQCSSSYDGMMSRSTDRFSSPMMRSCCTCTRRHSAATEWNAPPADPVAPVGLAAVGGKGGGDGGNVATLVEPGRVGGGGVGAMLLLLLLAAVAAAVVVVVSVGAVVPNATVDAAAAPGDGWSADWEPMSS